MRIAGSCLFLVSAAFLNFIGLICSEPVTLEDLFPGCKGVMPPVEELLFQNQLPNFETFRNKQYRRYHYINLIKRKHIIFGWSWELAFPIIELRKLFYDIEDVSLAFDMNQKRWITIPQDLSRQLGVNRYFHFLVARDQLAATHVTTSKNPRYKGAHIIAVKEANDRADAVELEQIQPLTDKNITLDESFQLMKEEYSQAYNHAFMRHLHPHGENQIHGHRGKHP